MNKHNSQSILKYLLLIAIALSAGCGQSTIADSPTLTPAPSQTFQPPTTVTYNLLPTVTPMFTKSAITSTPIPQSPSPALYSVPTRQPKNECLSPLVNFAFPVGVITNLGNVTPHPRTLPPSNWQFQVSIPDEFGHLSHEEIKSIGDEIWITGHINYSGSTSFFVYNTSENQGRIHRGGVNEIVPQKLLATRDTSLWGVGYNKQKSLLSKYNRSRGVFELINDKDGVLMGNDYAYIYDVVDIQEDNQGKIWILFSETGLYRFDPNTQKADYFLATPDNIKFTRFMPVQDGSIWILGYRFNPFRETVLLRYFPETGDLQPYQGTFSYAPESEDFPNLDISPYSPLLLDSANRLWISNEGWLSNPASERPSWYRIIQDPIFMNAWVDGVGNFYRTRPYGLSESSDGMFWFWGGIGTVRLNPEIGEWCLFTTYSSPVVEDKDHNLWIVADNKLYKYPLSQK